MKSYTNFENQPFRWPSAYGEAIARYLIEQNPRKSYFIKSGRILPFEDTVRCFVFEKGFLFRKRIAYIQHTSGIGPGHLYIESLLPQTRLEEIVKRVRDWGREGPSLQEAEATEKSVENFP